MSILYIQYKYAIKNSKKGVLLCFSFFIFKNFRIMF